MNKLELIEIEENYFSFSGVVEYHDNGKKVEKHITLEHLHLNNINQKRRWQFLPLPIIDEIINL